MKVRAMQMGTYPPGPSAVRRRKGSEFDLLKNTDFNAHWMMELDGSGKPKLETWKPKGRKVPVNPVTLPGQAPRNETELQRQERVRAEQEAARKAQQPHQPPQPPNQPVK